MGQFASEFITRPLLGMELLMRTLVILQRTLAAGTQVVKTVLGRVNEWNSPCAEPHQHSTSAFDEQSSAEGGGS